MPTSRNGDGKLSRLMIALPNLVKGNESMTVQQHGIECKIKKMITRAFDNTLNEDESTQLANLV